jgi:hypothetical protein
MVAHGQMSATASTVGDARRDLGCQPRATLDLAGLSLRRPRRRGGTRCCRLRASVSHFAGAERLLEWFQNASSRWEDPARHSRRLFAADGRQHVYARPLMVSWAMSCHVCQFLAEVKRMKFRRRARRSRASREDRFANAANGWLPRHLAQQIFGDRFNRICTTCPVFHSKRPISRSGRADGKMHHHFE